MSQASPSAPLGSLFKTNSGGTPLKSRKEYYEGGQIPWLLSGEVAQGEVWTASNFITPAGLQNSSAKIFPTDTVLVAMYGATAGQVGMLKIEAATNQAVCGILPTDQFFPEYLYYFLLSKKDELVGKAVGNAQPNISQAKIRETMVPIVGKADQRRIVVILDEAFDAIATAKANTEKNLQNARRFYECQLESLFAFEDTNWPERPLDQVATIINGYAFKSTDFQGTLGIRSIKITNVGVRVFVDDQGNYLPTAFCRKYTGVAVAQGNIVLALTRTIIASGLKVAIVPNEFDGALLNQRVAAIQPNVDVLETPFLFAYLSTRRVVNYVKSRVNTLMQPNLSIADLRRLPLSIPVISKQREIVAVLTRFDDLSRELESVYLRRLAALDDLKRSLLQQAFSGGLTAKSTDIQVTEFA